MGYVEILLWRRFLDCSLSGILDVSSFWGLVSPYSCFSGSVWPGLVSPLSSVCRSASSDFLGSSSATISSSSLM